MKKIHWAGGIDLPGMKMLKGFPCCVSGARAYVIRNEGMMNYSDPKQVTCKRCQVHLRAAGLL